jgi:glutaredoxin-like YruB-family protein
MAINLYTTPSCGYCVKAKDFLRKNGIKFNEYNVASDLRRLDEMRRKSGQQGVPVIDINGKIIIGFNQPEVEKALR